MRLCQFESLHNLKTSFSESRVATLRDVTIPALELSGLIRRGIVAGISIESLDELMKDYGGVWYPAHIDRNSYSIISALGDFPLGLETPVFELTYEADERLYREKYPETKNRYLLRSSDAHYLEKLMTEKCEIELKENSAKALIEKLSNIPKI